ncbi:ABC transporter ATP-binding protein [Paenibacillus sp. FJAT-26967]|uniref:dipeptide ABC transporter ATP-binding protein n=1 Tax=Paenibacillus sp. FJAT-26967 TaxID=1729690 RepID=UPI0008391BF1|nr:ABC transporter ATP-binding protein [Paenibacillus sp. FJAT-26967]
MGEALLEIDRLSVDFIKGEETLAALSDLTLHIERGETVCLVGESGSGKTILSKAIMRLIEYEKGRITQGSIRLGEMEITSWSQHKMRTIRGKRIAMIFQEPMSAFDPVFPVGRQIMDAILQHTRLSGKEARDHAVHLLNRVGIPEPELRMKQYPGELSGGMLQRAMIAMALSCGPELLIADEPTTALDVTVQAQILQLLQELQEETGMSMLLVTHDLGVAAQMANRIVVMYAGKIIEAARSEVLYERPLHPYTQGLLRSLTTPHIPRGTKLPSIEGAIPALADLPGGCRFHPRCPHAVPHCVQSAPPLRTYADSQAACWLTEELEEAQQGEREYLETKGADLAPAGLSSVDREREAVYTDVPLLHNSARRKELVNEDLPERAAVSSFSGTDRNRIPVEPARGDWQSVKLPVIEQEAAGLGEILFDVKGLRKIYETGGGLLSRARSRIYAVDGVSFTIRAGETFGLVGESGSGKSTLGRSLLRLDKPTEGKVLFEGKDIGQLSSKEMRDARRQMQVIYQDPYGSLNPRWTVGELIGEPYAVHGSFRGPERRERVQQLLHAVGLPRSAAGRYPHEFSGGQRQRIGIARAMALKPKFILADEAVSALDVSVQAQILNLLQELQSEEKLTYLFIGHGLSVVRHMSDRIGVMYLGRLVEIATSDELFRHPAHPYTAALLASIPSADPRRRMKAVPLSGEIPSPAHPPSGCRFHTRCPSATALCREIEPAWSKVGKDHETACHHPL